ncbi:hypothetical protein AB0395_43155 [Streptosporangium sp. NPDC051023]|uniref:hypothetical protein n=1 Tax=Streptosporangium sp. NPDC051023 TaxID=3155410 RepID=UPI00344C79A3
MHWTRLAAATIAALSVAATMPAAPAGAATGSAPPSGRASAVMAYPTAFVQVRPTSWSGDCAQGHTFTFTGQIAVLLTPETVRYRWIRSDNGATPVQELSFGLGQTTKSVSTTWRIGAPGSYSEAIEILSPNHSYSNWASFRLQCTS